MQNYSNYFSRENLNYSSQLNLSSTLNNQAAPKVQNPSYNPANQPYYSNYFKEFDNPPNQASLQAELPSQQIPNSAQNLNRNLLDKFRGSNERIEHLKQAPSSQNMQNHNFLIRGNQPISAPDGDISSISNTLSSAFLSKDEVFNNSRREQGQLQENNPQNEQNQLEVKVNRAIADKRVSVISLVNQVAMKVKKINPNFEVQYSQPNMNLPAYQCNLKYDSETIAVGRGNSKQDAKEDAAKQILTAFLRGKKYAIETQHIILYLRENGIAIDNERILQEEYKNEHINEPENPDAHSSPLYDMNLIARECFFEVKWDISSQITANGGFKAKLYFDVLTAYGEGRNKADAKREAAQKILEQIKSSRELSEKYDYKKNKKGITYINSGNMVREQPNVLLESFDVLKQSAQSFQISADENAVNLRNDCFPRIDSTFDDYLTNIDKKSRPKDTVLIALIDFFEQVSEYTKTISTNQKKPIQNSHRNLAVYFEGCSLESIGSFTLDCLRSNALSIDALLLLEKECNGISEQDLLIFYQDCLLEARATSQIQYKIEAEVVVGETGAYLRILVPSPAGQFFFKVQVARDPQFNTQFNSPACRRYTDSLLHINRIGKRLEDCDLPSDVRKLMKLLRIWRRSADLLKLPPELLDAILVNICTKQKGETMEVYVIQCLTVIGTQDSATTELRKIAPYYERMYREIPEQTKWIISTKCNLSLEAIFNEDFNNSGFSF